LKFMAQPRQDPVLVVDKPLNSGGMLALEEVIAVTELGGSELALVSYGGHWR